MQPTQINEFLSVAGQISKADVAEIAKQGFGTIINQRPDNEEPGQLDHSEAEAEAKKRGLEYRYQPIVTGNITRAQVAEFEKMLLRSPKPVLAHCRSGTRCYLMWAASRAIFNDESPLKLVAEAAVKGYDLRVLPSLVEKLEAEKAQS
ncbi:MAG TPA: TIGR01244 family sulfur transferase [Stellaceae bacterium]